MRHRHLARLVAALVALAILIAACGDDDASGEPLLLGSVYNLTGFQEVLDLPSSHGAELAAITINQDGGVLGRDLTLVPVEGDSDPATLATGVNTLLEDRPEVVAFLGLSDTDMLLAAAPPAVDTGRVFLTSGATSPQLPAQIPGPLFLACFGDNVQAAAGAEWAFDTLEARTALVLYDPAQTYTDLLEGYFIDRFAGLGGTVTASEPFDPRAEQVELPPLADGVDLVFLAVETAEDAARVIPLLRDAGYAGPILGGDGYDAESVWAEHPDVADVYFTTHVYLGPDNPNPAVGAFLEAYAATYPDEPPSAFAALGYDAVGLLAAAIDQAGDASPDAIASGLAALEDYEGVTGRISFTDGNHIPTKGVTILRVADGEQQFVEEVVPEEVPRP